MRSRLLHRAATTLQKSMLGRGITNRPLEAMTEVQGTSTEKKKLLFCGVNLEFDSHAHAGQ